MSDFVIKTKDGRDFGADDVAVDNTGTMVKYIERYSHTVKMIPLNSVTEISRERRGWEGGPAFGDGHFAGGWKRPV